MPIKEKGIHMLNQVNLQGKIANFGKVYRAAEGEKQAFCVLFVNVITSTKKNPETGYYDSVAVKVVGWGYSADRMNAFEPGEEMYFTGSLTKEQDWTNQEGELVKGQLMIAVQNVHNFAKNYNAEGAAPAGAKSAKPAKPAAAKPAANKPGRPARPSMA